MAEQPKQQEVSVPPAAEQVPAAPAPTPAAPAAEAPAEKPRTAPPLPEGTLFVRGTGRRKKAIARVRVRPGEGKFLVNERPADEYFKLTRDRHTIRVPLQALHMVGSYDVWARVDGGGYAGQADAVMLGLARALVRAAPDEEAALRGEGLLTRDARMKERKKPGQPGARKRFQYSKR